MSTINIKLKYKLNVHLDVEMSHNLILSKVYFINLYSIDADKGLKTF